MSQQVTNLWSISASDSTAGAGSQADLSVCRALSVDVSQILTAVTSQSSRGVSDCHSLPTEVIDAQWQALSQDGLPDIIKLGWLPPCEKFRDWLITQLANHSARVIWDPVKSSTANIDGMLPIATGDFWHGLLPYISIITPNRDELLWLTESQFNQLDSQVTDLQRCQWLQQAGVNTVVLTGADDVAQAVPQPEPLHHSASNIQPDLNGFVRTRVCHSPTDGFPEEQLAPTFAMWQKRQEKAAHGSGCHFSTAIAAYLALGYRLYDAILYAGLMASASVANAFVRSSNYHNCCAMKPTIEAATDWPWVTQWDEFPGNPVGVKLSVSSLGLYALTDNLTHLTQLLELGVDTIQWRVKQRSDDFIEQTRQALSLCRQAGVAFWLNDYWQLGLELKVDGVHLGQEDCCDADLEALRQQGIALGISNHTDWEIARARCFAPSYLAFGPVHPPLSKQLKYPPLGYQRLARYVQANDDFLHTCIGGITSENVIQVAATGIQSAAIVTALLPGLQQQAEHQALAKCFAVQRD